MEDNKKTPKQRVLDAYPNALAVKLDAIGVMDSPTWQVLTGNEEHAEVLGENGSANGAWKNAAERLQAPPEPKTPMEVFANEPEDPMARNRKALATVVSPGVKIPTVRVWSDRTQRFERVMRPLDKNGKFLSKHKARQLASLIYGLEQQFDVKLSPSN